eukprot:COSAG02_NODE_19210_length_894_cov_1.353459_1_plen_41_part_10
MGNTKCGIVCRLEPSKFRADARYPMDNFIRQSMETASGKQW